MNCSFCQLIDASTACLRTPSPWFNLCQRQQVDWRQLTWSRAFVSGCWCTRQIHKIKKNIIFRDFLIIKNVACGPDYRAARLGRIKNLFSIGLDKVMRVAHYFIKTDWPRVEVLPIHYLDELKANTWISVLKILNVSLKKGNKWIK